MAKKSTLAKAQELAADRFEQKDEFEDKEPEMQATDVFFRNQESKKPIVINRGGGGSSKSFSLYQLFLYKFFNESRKKFLICRKTLPAARGSCYYEMHRLALEYRLRDEIYEEKVHLNWYYNDNLMMFKGLDDPEKIKSVNVNYVLMEEATEFTYEDFQQLRLRMREPSYDGNRNQLFLAFNPIDEFHWIKTKILDNPAYGDDIEEIFSTYKDNPFLAEDSVRVLEGYAAQDPSFYNIYTLGQWGKLENIIYKNWDQCDWVPDVASCEKVMYGLDFGFNDPTVLMRVSIKGKDAWLEELIHHTKLTTAMLIPLMQEKLPSSELRRKQPIYADPSRPEEIEELKKAGFYMKPAVRSIVPGIDSVKRYRLHIKSDALNTIKEFRSYSWKKDKHGNVVDDPVDALNHSPDAVRYAIHTATRGATGIKVRWLN